jgi:polar amino acid transport system ATP-binding protein
VSEAGDIPHIPTGGGEPLVVAVEVVKRFGSLEVLKGISLRVAPGEVVCVIGPSGSGKSTFLRCINQLERIDGGAIFVAGELVGFRRVGHELHELDDRAVARQRSRIGMVFQRFNLFPHLTVTQNVTEGPIRVKGESPAAARDTRTHCSTGSASATSARRIRHSSPEGSSSASPSPARSPCGPT